DHVFAVNLGTSSEQIIPQQKLTWKTKDVAKCTVRGKNSVSIIIQRNIFSSLLVLLVLFLLQSSLVHACVFTTVRVCTKACLRNLSKD
ncbi:hypothetical protein XENOCAPTIV_027812, partial [Xenoophorus captivus]